MSINEAIAEVIINFAKHYPLLSGIFAMLFILRPFNKIGSKIVHKKIKSNKLSKIIHKKWYLIIVAWLIDVIFSIKIVEENSGKYTSEKFLDNSER